MIDGLFYILYAIDGYRKLDYRFSKRIGYR